MAVMLEEAMVEEATVEVTAGETMEEEDKEVV
jgi:hypothetical protein